MRVSIFALLVSAGCASLGEYTPRESATREEAASCWPGSSLDEARLASPAAIASVEPFTVLMSS